MNKGTNRLSIFVDGGYFNAIQRVYKVDFSFPLFVAEIKQRLAGRLHTALEDVHTCYYDCLPYVDERSPQADRDAYYRKQSFFTFLNSQPEVRVREGLIVKRNVDGQAVFQQKQVDLRLSLDIADECNIGLITHIALVTGDGDFVPTIEYARRKEVQVWLFYTKQAFSLDLWSTADGRIEVDEEFARAVTRESL